MSAIDPSGVPGFIIVNTSVATSVISAPEVNAPVDPVIINVPTEPPFFCISYVAGAPAGVFAIATEAGKFVCIVTVRVAT